MVAASFHLLLLQGLSQHLQQAGDGLDQAARERMQQRAEYLKQEMARLIQEMEQKSLEQSTGAWGALLLWQFAAVLGILLLLLALWFRLQKRKCDPDNSGQKESSSSNLEKEEKEEEESNLFAKNEIGSNHANVDGDEDNGNKEGSGVDAKEGGNVGKEAKEGYSDAKGDVNKCDKGEKVNAAGNEDKDNDANEEDDELHHQSILRSFLGERMVLPVVELDRGSSVIGELMDKVTGVFGQGLSKGFYPVPQEAMGVGSAFEGWSPCAEDVVYSVLVALSPPPGHAFHLEEDATGMARKNFSVRVELLCTCTREQPGQDVLCFLHHPEEELKRKQEPSLLHTLCTGSYLDVEKTAHWFCGFLRAAWLLLPESCHWRLMVRPSSRSCKLQLSNDKESFTAEMILGVRQGDSDVFVGSQLTQVGMPSTTWLETYAVVEAKFFRHISRLAPQDSWHCKCLQLLTHSLMGIALSSYTLKTVVMHLLSSVPLTRWSRRDFWQRLMEILDYLHSSLETKRLNHFVIGNQRFPLEIALPSDLRLAEPLNLFQDLASDPDEHAKALWECFCLLHRLNQLLIYGH